MSYYKTKAIRLKKDGSISITAACNNVTPITYWTSTYHGTLAELLKSINEGNFHLGNGKSLYVYKHIDEAIDEIGRYLSEKGLDWDTCYTYDIRERDEAIMAVCELYADRIRTNDWTDPKKFGTEAGNRIEPILHRGLQKLGAIKAADEVNGVIRASCAASSIFEGYLLIQPRCGEREFILAPEGTYKPGILKTDPAKIIHLGKESAGLYGFLSDCGINMTMEEYIHEQPANELAIRDKYERTVKIVNNVLAKGARLRNGVYPYKGFVVTC